MKKNELFTIIPARKFFTRYAPEVKRFYHKANGIDGNKQPIDFSLEDQKAIKAGVKKLIQDLQNIMKNRI